MKKIRYLALRSSTCDGESLLLLLSTEPVTTRQLNTECRRLVEALRYFDLKYDDTDADASRKRAHRRLKKILRQNVQPRFRVVEIGKFTIA
jgi:hypothetical protein